MRASMLVVLVPLVPLVACGSPPGDTTVDGGPRDGALDARLPDAPPGAISVFDPSVTQVAIEIDYEAGKAPYTGFQAGFGDTFDVTVNNLERVFSGKKQLSLPTTVSQMQNLGTVADEALTVSDLLALADAHRTGRDAPGRKSYYIMFLGGYFADGSGPQQGVLGVSLGGTGVIAMFKDVVESTGGLLPGVEPYVEQSTLVHELAHAIGLVDNGVPMATPHKDAPHGAHCDDDRCVMYWLNEGASDAATFARQRVLTNDTILFDDACLADVDALTGGP